MRKTLSAPARLEMLVPWLNGEPLTSVEVQHQLDAFVHSFAEATEETAHVRVVQPPSAGGANASTLERLRDTLRSVLDSGFARPNRTTGERSWEVRLRPYQLRFGALRRSDETPKAYRAGEADPETKLSRFTKRERDAYSAAGAYELLVSGPLGDIVPYLVIHLLTAPAAVAVARCPAPAPNDWQKRCDRFVIRTGRGRPQEFCSEACRVRRHAEKLRAQQEKQAKAMRRIQKKRRRRA